MWYFQLRMVFDSSYHSFLYSSKICNFFWCGLFWLIDNSWTCSRLRLWSVFGFPPTLTYASVLRDIGMRATWSYVFILVSSPNMRSLTLEKVRELCLEHSCLMTLQKFSNFPAKNSKVTMIVIRHPTPTSWNQSV